MLLYRLRLEGGPLPVVDLLSQGGQHLPDSLPYESAARFFSQIPDGRTVENLLDGWDLPQKLLGPRPPGFSGWGSRRRMGLGFLDVLPP